MTSFFILNKVNNLTTNRHFYLKKNKKIYLRPNGEMCNRISQGTKVEIIKIKKPWYQISWRSGKKKGWALLSENNF
ncbi:uncharacterized protein METZ01_LOCUS409793 [marine metagenome]|uniref:SH3b domain-containing protein n=1 Tax=marine metagenome TaxID=408172 RepID=A0A382WE14_9ZZZZ